MALPFCITRQKKEAWVFIFKTNISHPPAVLTFPSHADGNELETQFPETTSCTFSTHKLVISTFSQSEIKCLLAFSSATSLEKACTVVQFPSLAHPGVVKQLMEVQMQETKMNGLSHCRRGAEPSRRSGCQVPPWQLTGIFRVGLSALIDCSVCNKHVCGHTLMGIYVLLMEISLPLHMIICINPWEYWVWAQTCGAANMPTGGP